MWVRIWFTKVHTIIRSKYCYVQAQLLWDFVPRLDFAHRQTNIVVVAWQREFVRFCWVWLVIFGLGIGCTGEYTRMYVFFFGWAQLKCTFRFEVVRPSDRPFVRLSITFPVIQAWRVEREHVWLNDFYKLLLPFVCCYATINVWKCMQKARTYFATIAKKRKIKQ